MIFVITNRITLFNSRITHFFYPQAVLQFYPFLEKRVVSLFPLSAPERGGRNSPTTWSMNNYANQKFLGLFQRCEPNFHGTLQCSSWYILYIFMITFLFTRAINVFCSICWSISFLSVCVHDFKQMFRIYLWFILLIFLDSVHTINHSVHSIFISNRPCKQKKQPWLILSFLL